MISGRLNSCHTAVRILRRFSLGESDSSKNIRDTTHSTTDRWIIHVKMSTSGVEATEPARHRNRLALERSPYLLQHASNPVDWYPWSVEAFEKAREQNKLIFLSVGYSTCHWCHVMERESFENEDVAKVMNAHFINIKVDREERPDVDKIYMTFVQASTGGGGWPMSVWLTPQLTPVFGGTYYPPTDRYGRRGFKSLLEIINEQWQENPGKFIESGSKVVQVLQASAELDGAHATAPPSMDCADKCLHQLRRSYESEHGGFNRAPKFPQPTNLNFLLHYYSRSPESETGIAARDMCIHTLACMARGGIHDHVAQGFARYSTDERWHVPHFEKMLYDQGQLAVAYAAAFLVTQDSAHEETLRDILTYVGRDLSHESGGFYSAEDADSLPTADATEKKEGAFCVWTHKEVCSLLSEPIADSQATLAQVFCAHYDVKAKGNVDPAQDPHNELTNQNVLMVNGSVEATATKLKLTTTATETALRRARDILFEVRSRRPRPHRDDKMIAAWNGLMISGYARASQALHDEAYEQRAIAAARFIKQHLYDASSVTLLRSCYTGQDGHIAQISVPISGFVDDYSFVVRGLLDLYETCLDIEWLEWAEQLQDTQDRLFWDDVNAGYFTSPSDDPNIIIRLKEDQDGAEPSGNSVSTSNLLRLASYLERHDLRDKAARLMTGFVSRLTRVPAAMPELVSALMMYHDSATQVFVYGERSEPGTAALLRVVHSRLIPGRVLALVDGNEASLLHRKNETVRRMKRLNGLPTAFVCRHHNCLLPVTDPDDLAKLLD